jgi:hypothetical protein
MPRYSCRSSRQISLPNAATRSIQQSSAPSSVRGYREDGHLGDGTGLGDRRKYHQEGKHPLGIEITIVDPKPMVAVACR